MAAPLDGRGCLTHWVVERATRSARHRWVTTVSLSPHTGVHLSSGHCGRVPSWLCVSQSTPQLDMCA